MIPNEMAEEFDAGEFPSLQQVIVNYLIITDINKIMLQAADMASGVLRLEKTETTNARLFSVRQPEDSKVKDNGDQEMETGEDEVEEGGHSGGQPDILMDIDSKDDEWLLEAAKQFQCASEDQGAVQDKYKVRFILLHSTTVRVRDKFEDLVCA